MEFVKILGWTCSLLSVYGAWLNIQKKKSCFIVWTVANIGFISLIPLGRVPLEQLILWITFSACNVYGYLAWRKDELKQKAL